MKYAYVLHIMLESNHVLASMYYVIKNYFVY